MYVTIVMKDFTKQKNTKSYTNLMMRGLDVYHQSAQPEKINGLKNN